MSTIRCHGCQVTCESVADDGCGFFTAAWFCQSCSVARIHIARFVREVLSTNRAERSNSRRIRLVEIFHATIAVFSRSGDEATARRAKRAMDHTRDISCFTPDADFDFAIRQSAATIPANADFWDALHREIEKDSTDRLVKAVVERLEHRSVVSQKNREIRDAFMRHANTHAELAKKMLGQ